MLILEFKHGCFFSELGGFYLGGWIGGFELKRDLFNVPFNDF